MSRYNTTLLRLILLLGLLYGATSAGAEAESMPAVACILKGGPVTVTLQINKKGNATLRSVDESTAAAALDCRFHIIKHDHSDSFIPYHLWNFNMDSCNAMGVEWLPLVRAELDVSLRYSDKGEAVVRARWQENSPPSRCEPLTRSAGNSFPAEPETAPETLNYSVWLGGGRKIPIDIRKVEDLLVNEPCFDGECLAIAAADKERNPAVNMNSCHGHTAWCNCMALGGNGGTLHDDKHNADDFCQFEDGSMVSGWHLLRMWEISHLTDRE